jgi:hypothetical protein
MKKFLTLCAFVALVAFAAAVPALANVALDDVTIDANGLAIVVVNTDTPNLATIFDTGPPIDQAAVMSQTTLDMNVTTNAYALASVVSNTEETETWSGISEVVYADRSLIAVASFCPAITTSTDAKSQVISSREVDVTVHRGMEVDYVGKMPIVATSQTQTMGITVNTA